MYIYTHTHTDTHIYVYNAYKRCLKRPLKVKLYLAEQILENKVYWYLNQNC